MKKVIIVVLGLMISSLSFAQKEESDYTSEENALQDSIALIELAVGIDAPLDEICDCEVPGTLLYPLDSMDYSYGMKNILYFKTHYGEWVKLDRKGRKELSLWLNETKAGAEKFNVYKKKIRKSNLLMAGSFILLAPTMIAPGGYFLTILELGVLGHFSFRIRNKAQGYLIEAVGAYNSEVLKKHVTPNIILSNH